MNSKHPRPGQVHHHVQNLLANSLCQVDNLWEGDRVKKELDLSHWTGAKYSKDNSVKGGTIDSFQTPQAVQPVPNLLQGGTASQQMLQVTTNLMAGARQTVSTLVC